MEKKMEDYRSLLEAAIYNWYYKECKFPDNEAKEYTNRLIDKIFNNLK